MLRTFNSNPSLIHYCRRCKEPINVDIQIELDKYIGNAPTIKEQFSRVILNLCNNTFDAMREKGLQSKLTARTKSDNGEITNEIKGNGLGIPAEIRALAGQFPIKFNSCYITC